MLPRHQPSVPHGVDVIVTDRHSPDLVNDQSNSLNLWRAPRELSTRPTAVLRAYQSLNLAAGVASVTGLQRNPFSHIAFLSLRSWMNPPRKVPVVRDC